MWRRLQVTEIKRIYEDEEFLSYRENLHKHPYFTFPTERDLSEFNSLSLPPKQISARNAKKHPFTWMSQIIGVTPRDYQYKMLNSMFLYNRVAGVTSRQVGKSFCIGGFAFWAAYNNVKPTGTPKKTRIGIVSQTEGAAKELLGNIRDLVNMADERWANATRNTPYFEKQYFTNRMSVKPTQYKLEWPGGSITIYPPTSSVRGKSLSYLIIDEADFLNCSETTPDEFFHGIAAPTVKATQGSIFLFSTPKGTPTYFNKIIRPNNDSPIDGWIRIWMPWTINNEESDMETGWKERKAKLQTGEDLKFRVEYEASFESGRYTFFPPAFINDAVDDALQEEFDWHGPVTVGLDFGDTHSRTVLTVVSHDKERNETTLLWYKEFKAGFNNGDLPKYIKTLRGRYNITQIVVDDCVGGKTAIEMLRRDGWNLRMFVFKRDKHEYFEYIKAAFANKRIKLYDAPDVIAQLKGIESVETIAGNVQIRKPAGGRDDIVDSFVMACSPFIQPKRMNKRIIF